MVEELRVLHLPDELERLRCVALCSRGVSTSEAEARTPLAHVRFEVVGRPGLALGEELVRVTHAVLPAPAQIFEAYPHSAAEAHHALIPESPGRA